MPHEHFLEQHDPERKDFQIDRIILFSDAVLAIAITLLVIEIKAPEFEHGLPERKIVSWLLYQIPKFIGFIISFFVIAIYWRSHHRIFGFVNRYTSKLIWLNFFFLFTVALMPFSSAFYSENMLYHVPFYFYNINIICTGLANYATVNYVFNPANQIVTHWPNETFIKIFKARSLITPGIFLLGIIIGTIWLPAGWYMPLLIAPVLSVVSRSYKRKPTAANA
ncbi:TMEM175 family protein [Mucilaginibacter sp.]